MSLPEAVGTNSGSAANRPTMVILAREREGEVVKVRRGAGALVVRWDTWDSEGGSGRRSRNDILLMVILDCKFEHKRIEGYLISLDLGWIMMMVLELRFRVRDALVRKETIAIS